MSNLRTNLTSGMNYLRRRFSSDDLLNEGSSSSPDHPAKFSFPKKIPLPSAPTFPSFSSMQGLTRGLLSSGNVHSSDHSSSNPSLMNYNKTRSKTILIIDDRHTDWAKYFVAKKVFGDWDIKIEQAEFSELNLASYRNEGVLVEIHNSSQPFQPDMVLIRQHPRNANENFRNIVLGLHYGGVPCLNNLEAVYNFLDKPWVFSHLMRIQKRLGEELFPLIDQTYYPNHREMINNLWLVIPKFPVVIKIGHAFSGLGKVKVDNHYVFQDIASVMAVTNCYSTMESYVQSQGDIYIQKIGTHYKAFIRKAMSGNWKANIGSAILEEIPVNERYKLWIDECSRLFGGLDMLSIKALKGIDGREYIIEVNDSSMPLLGNSHDDDCGLIADLLLRKMESLGNINSSSFPQTFHQSRPYIQQQQHHQQQQQHQQPSSPQQQQQHQQQHSIQQQQTSSSTPHMTTVTTPKQQPQRSLSLASVTNFFDFPSGQLQTKVAPLPVGEPASPGTIDAIARDLEGSDDTMNNLRKTFAGIFGNLQ